MTWCVSLGSERRQLILTYFNITRFENVKAGEPFSHRGALSCDYSLQFMIGWNNYTQWKAKQKVQAAEPDPQKKILLALPTKRVVYRPTPNAESEDLLDAIHFEDVPPRAGPVFTYTPRD